MDQLIFDQGKAALLLADASHSFDAADGARPDEAPTERAANVARTAARLVADPLVARAAFRLHVAQSDGYAATGHFAL